MRNAILPTRGHPLLALAALTLGWTAARLMLWHSPFPEEFSSGAGPTVASDAAAAGREAARRAGIDGAEQQNAEKAAHASVGLPVVLRETTVSTEPIPYRGARRLLGPDIGTLSPDKPRHEPLPFAAASGTANAAPPRTAPRRARDAAPLSLPRQAGREKRWSLSAWSLYREGSQGAVAAVGVPSYGASQAGAVLRFALAPKSGHVPELFARASHALVDHGETELALGLSARPLPAIPLRAHAELRATDAPAGRELRPAAFATTELPEVDLPLGLKGSAYGQAGYVGGRFATGFVDGAARLEREVAAFDTGRSRAKPRIGAGLWGGAQRGAARLDIGPAASIAFEGGPLPMRLSLDYRFRIAGDAEPGDGVAVTLSTGF